MTDNQHFKCVPRAKLVTNVDELRTEIAHLDSGDASQRLAVAPLAVSEMAKRLVQEAETIANAFAQEADAFYSGPMISEGIRNLCVNYCDAAVLSKRRAKWLGNIGADQQDGPKVLFHNLAGNLFVSGWESIFHGLLLGCSNVVRCSRMDQVFPVALQQEWLATERAWPSGVVPLLWDHTKTEITAEVIRSTDASIFFGSDDALRAISKFVPADKPHRMHGSRASFEVLDLSSVVSSDLAEIADAVAYDFSVYDQQGCLSPRTLFLRKHTLEEAFIELLYISMRRMALRLPRGMLSLEEKAVLCRHRDTTILAQISGDPNARVVSLPDEDFLLTLNGINGDSLAPAGRCVDVRFYDRNEQVIKSLASYQGKISTIGFSGDDHLSAALADMGIERFCRPGQMQKPELGWLHDKLRPFEGLF